MSIKLVSISACSLLVAASMSGCMLPPAPLGAYYHVSIDPAFSTAQQEDIEDAMLSWQTSVPALEMTYTVQGCPSEKNQEICIHAADHNTVVANGGAPANSVVAVTVLVSSSDINHFGQFVDGGEMWVDNMNKHFNPDNGNLKKTMLHEIGHAMGLHHMGKGTDIDNTMSVIMCPDLHNAPAELTCLDVSQWYQYRRLVTPACD